MITPRPYISWTQYSLFNRSESEYIRLYLDDEDGYSSKEIDFGKKFADALENDDLIGDPNTDMVLSALPRHPEMEYEINTEIAGVPVHCRLDSFNPESGTKPLIEYKTSKNEWTQRKADTHEQIDFYAAAVFSKYEVIPEPIQLVYVPTCESDNNQIIVDPNKEICLIETKRTMGDVIEMGAKIKQTWDDIMRVSEEYYGKES